MLAYLFWHEPQPEVGAERYVGLLRGFHRALAAAPPPSFVRSWSVRLDVAPWDAGPAGRPFEDWYLVEDWGALGTLNEAAVPAPRAGGHDRIGGRGGRGGARAPGRGPPPPPRGPRGGGGGWPRRAGADAAGGGAVLRRQMV